MCDSMLDRRTPVLLLSLLAACSAGGADGYVAGGVFDDTAGAADSVAGVAAGSLDERRVLGLLRHVHASDSAVGSLGAQRGSSRAIRDFGLMITREHMALRRDAALLADSLGIDIQAPRVTPAGAPAGMRDALLATPAGSGWDRAYLEYALAEHSAALENTARALAATKSEATRAYIRRTVPILQKHIDKAGQLRQALGGGAAQDTSGAGAQR